MYENDLLVCVSSPPDFDHFTFSCWTEGKNIDEVTQIILNNSNSTTSTTTTTTNANTNSNNVNTISNNSSSIFVEKRWQRWEYNAGQVEALKLSGIEDSTISDGSYANQEWKKIIKNEVNDQYRCYELIEHYISQPSLFKDLSQLSIQIPLKSQSYVLEKYWALDDNVVREILNKKLSKSRKDLDDITESCCINLRRVTRQFDNVRKIYTAIDEGPKFECNLYQYCIKNFRLSTQLAKKYACVMFLLYTKFNITSKKRLLKLSSESLELCAMLIMGSLVTDQETYYKIADTVSAHYQHLAATATTSNASVSIDTPTAAASIKGIDSDTQASTNSFIMAATEKFDEAMPMSLYTGDNEECWQIMMTLFTRYTNSVDIDKQLMGNLRDIRTVLTQEVLDEGCVIVRNAFTTLGGGKKKLDVVKIRSILKALMLIGANLSQTREFRDIFIDLLTKVTEPLEEIGLTSSDIQTFLIACIYVAKLIPIDIGRSMSISQGDSVRSSITSSSPRIMGVASPDRLDSINSMSSTSSNSLENKRMLKGVKLRRDWVRFLHCCRMCILMYR